MAKVGAASLTPGGKPRSWCLAVLLFDLLLPCGKCFEHLRTIHCCQNHLCVEDRWFDMIYDNVISIQLDTCVSKMSKFMNILSCTCVCVCVRVCLFVWWLPCITLLSAQLWRLVFDKFCWRQQTKWSRLICPSSIIANWPESSISLPFARHLLC